MTKDLIKTINELNRDEAIEAARFVSRSVAGDEPIDESLPALQAIADQPFAHLPDIEGLARLVLISAASTAEGAAEVERAIAGVGRKQLVLGGAEIVALAALGVVALKIIVTGGRGRTKRSIKLLDEDGKPYAEVEEIAEPVSITSELAAILRGTLGLGGGSQPKSSG